MRQNLLSQVRRRKHIYTILRFEHSTYTKDFLDSDSIRLLYPRDHPAQLHIFKYRLEREPLNPVSGNNF